MCFWSIHACSELSCTWCWQAFRPLLILFIFGQIIKALPSFSLQFALLLTVKQHSEYLKGAFHTVIKLEAFVFQAVFFIAGAPIWMSFYSIWLFEAAASWMSCLRRIFLVVGKTLLSLGGYLRAGSMCDFLHFHQLLGVVIFDRGCGSWSSHTMIIAKISNTKTYAQ